MTGILSLFRNIEGFEWDQGNQEKNWINHQVTLKECEEVFEHLPLLINLDKAHSQREDRYQLLGKTDNSRFLFIAFTIRYEYIRVISARDQSNKERSMYAQANN